MAVFVNDPLNDTNGTALEDHVEPVSGVEWTEHGSYTSGGAAIQNNAVYPNTNQPWCFYASGDPATAEYDVEIVLDSITNATNHFTGLAGRIATGADTMYYVLLSGRVVSNPAIHLRKQVAGALTNLASDTTTILADDDVVKLEILDATKKVYVNDVEKLSSTDNAITAAGKAGFRGQGPGTASSTEGLHIKGITATDAGGATTHTGETTDDIKLTDTLAAALTAVGSLSEAVILSDSFVAALTAQGVLSDDIKLQDALAAAVTRPVAVPADDIKLLDAYVAAVIQIIEAAVTDDIKLTDSQAADVIRRAAMADDILLQDALAAVLTARASMTDNVVLSDSQAGNLTARTSMSDAITLAESFTAGLSMPVSHTQNIVFGDSWAATVSTPSGITAPVGRTCIIATPDRTCAIPSRSRTMTVT